MIVPNLIVIKNIDNKFKDQDNKKNRYIMEIC